MILRPHSRTDPTLLKGEEAAEAEGGVLYGEAKENLNRGALLCSPTWSWGRIIHLLSNHTLAQISMLQSCLVIRDVSITTPKDGAQSAEHWRLQESD